MTSEKQGLDQGPPSYEQTGGYPQQQPGGYPPPAGYHPVPNQQGGYQPPPQQGYVGQQPPQGYVGQPGQPGQPGQQAYGQPGQQGYAGQPGQPMYGQPGQPMYGQPGQPYCTQQVILAQPGQASVVVAQPRPPDYMIPAVLACCCCFCPTGLCAIYYASRANTLAAEGDMVEASRLANNAKNLMITSIVLGVAWMILFIIMRLAVQSNTNTYNYS